MENLVQLIRTANIKITSEKDYKKHSIYWGEYLNQKNHNVIGKYCFIQVSYEFWEKEIFQNDDFVKSVIEPEFYEIRSDLRWNLYFVCVFDDLEYKEIPLEDFLEFEQNTEYTRNIIVKESSFVCLIPTGKVFDSKGEKERPDPWNDWMEILEKEGLEFCLEEYKGDRLAKYIENEDTNTGKVRKTIDGYDVNIQKIEKLYLGSAYREQCFGKEYKVKLRDINLLDGRNGAGKTSVLDAIELTLTGKVRKTSVSTKEGEETGTSLLAKLKDETKEITIPKTAHEEKERENYWYQSRQSDRSKCILNQMFHLHNYFTTEDTFLFGFSQKQPDYNKNFSNILFTEEIGKAEYAWGRYKADAEQNIKKIIIELNNIDKKLKGMEGNTIVTASQIFEYWNKTDFSSFEEVTLDDIQSITLEFLTAYARIEDLEPVPGCQDTIKQIDKIPIMDEEAKYEKNRTDAFTRVADVKEKLAACEEEKIQHEELYNRRNDMKRFQTLFYYLAVHEAAYKIYADQGEELLKISDRISDVYMEYYETYKDIKTVEDSYENILSDAKNMEL